MKKLIDCLKIGDKVFDITTGWGTVTGLEDNRIFVKFRDDLGRWYEADGTMYHNNKNPSLFLEEIKLEQNLPFVEGEIVLVSEGHANCAWVVGKYSHKHKGLHWVYRSETDRPFDYRVSSYELVKSFDKSHFEQ